MTATVAVIGGGYAGITLAKALDDIADVTLIEPRDAFVHNVAALRGVADEEWVERIFIPYGKLLSRGRVRRDRAVRVSATEVTLASGDTIEADYVVLATGSTVPYPANFETEDSTAVKAQLRATRDELAAASHVLLLGAGPVGIEFAGEIKAAWPEKGVTIVDPLPELVGGRFPEEFRQELRAQLDALGIRLVLGAHLSELPATRPGSTGAFEVATESGVGIEADIWFPCYGIAYNTGYLAEDLAVALQPSRQVAVTPELRVKGQETVFAIGDITDVPELKMARLAQKHAEVVAGNIRALITGEGEVSAYEIEEEDSIALPLGPAGGVSYASHMGVLGAEATAGIKSTFYVEHYLELLGQQ